MDRGILVLYAVPGSMEQHKRARELNEAGPEAALLRQEELRRTQICMALELVGKAVTRERRRRLLQARSGLDAGRDDALVWAFYCLFHPDVLVQNEGPDGAVQLYNEIWSTLTT